MRHGKGEIDDKTATFWSKQPLAGLMLMVETFIAV